MRGKHQHILAIVATDNTFHLADVRGERAWVGKCVHCNSRLVVSVTGATAGATIEHILPKHHGGTDDLENLALACARCNSAKGKRVDPLRRNDPRLAAMLELLRGRRLDRWREPP